MRLLKRIISLSRRMIFAETILFLSNNCFPSLRIPGEKSCFILRKFSISPRSLLFSPEFWFYSFFETDATKKYL